MVPHLTTIYLPIYLETRHQKHQRDKRSETTMQDSYLHKGHKGQNQTRLYQKYHERRSSGKLNAADQNLRPEAFHVDPTSREHTKDWVSFPPQRWWCSFLALLVPSVLNWSFLRRSAPAGGDGSYVDASQRGIYTEQFKWLLVDMAFQESGRVIVFSPQCVLDKKPESLSGGFAPN